MSAASDKEGLIPDVCIIRNIHVLAFVGLRANVVALAAFIIVSPVIHADLERHAIIRMEGLVRVGMPRVTGPELLRELASGKVPSRDLCMLSAAA